MKKYGVPNKDSYIIKDKSLNNNPLRFTTIVVPIFKGDNDETGLLKASIEIEFSDKIGYDRIVGYQIVADSKKSVIKPLF